MKVGLLILWHYAWNSFLSNNVQPLWMSKPIIFEDSKIFQTLCWPIQVIYRKSIGKPMDHLNIQRAFNGHYPFAYMREEDQPA